ncbi:hypothetical protein [Streptomyces sp. NPDC088775]|uniref:hypothetical protein n=1 Tax=Streptomyces sp. NPDC088775 TaxID=3365896 RepID=UPI00381FEEBD
MSRARAETAHRDYPSMARWARALYETGRGPREVVRECYGTDFPEEFFLLAEENPHASDLLVDFTNQPWRLAVPLSEGGPPPEPDSREEIERRVFARDPGLLPLVVSLGMDTPLSNRVFCYHLDELHAGRPTVFGIGKSVRANEETVRFGGSLLDVLHRHHADYLALLTRQIGLPSNRGTGALIDEDVEEAQLLLEQVEQLQQKLADRPLFTQAGPAAALPSATPPAAPRPPAASAP